MLESATKSRAIVGVRGASPRGFDGGVTAEARYRKAVETRLRNLTNKKTAQGFLNAKEEKMFRHLTRTVRVRRMNRAGAISVRFLAPYQERVEVQKSISESGLKIGETSIPGAAVIASSRTRTEPVR